MNGKRTRTNASRDVQPAPESDPVASPSRDHGDDLGSLARELARGYAELVESHRRSWGIGPAEAIEKARMPRERALELVRTDPVEQLSWWVLLTAMEHDPEAALDTLRYWLGVDHFDRRRFNQELHQDALERAAATETNVEVRR